MFVLLRNLKKRFKRFVYTTKAKMEIGSYGAHLMVNNKSSFNHNCHFGSNCGFNGISIIGVGNVIIGNYFHSGSECMIITSNHNYEGESIPYDKSNIIKTIQIGDFVWMGNRVTIIGNVKIGEGAIIGACSVVCKDIPPLAIVAGNPARIIKYRDKNRFFYLKNNGNFY